MLNNIQKAVSPVHDLDQIIFHAPLFSYMSLCACRQQKPIMSILSGTLSQPPALYHQLTSIKDVPS